MKAITTSIYWLALPLWLSAQQVERQVVAAGGNYNESGFSIGYTVGEVAGTHYLGTDTHHCEGFQQGEYNNPALPVELLAFDGVAIPRGNQLYWTTAFEEDFSHFELEKSSDSWTFQYLATIFGEGASSLTDYEYLDEQPFPADNYYRLKIVDTDGSFRFSNIVHLKNSRTPLLEIRPNLVAIGQAVSIQGYYFDGNISSVKIHDSMGREVQRFSPVSSNGDFEWTVRLEQAGIYFISIQTDAGGWVERLLVME